MKEVQVAQLLPVTPEEYWQLFLADSEFKSRFHARRGDSAVRIGTWTPVQHSSDGALSNAKQRISTLDAPISSHGLVRTIVGSMFTSVRDVELLRVHSNGTLHLHSTVYLTGTIGEQFSCECNWIMQPCAQGTSVRVIARLEYHGAQFQGVLESHVAELTHAAFSLWLGMCNERIADLRPATRLAAPIPVTPNRRATTTSSAAPRIPSTPVTTPLHATSSGTNAGADLFDVTFESDAELNDTGGRRLSYSKSLVTDAARMLSPARQRTTLHLQPQQQQAGPAAAAAGPSVTATPLTNLNSHLSSVFVTPAAAAAAPAAAPAAAATTAAPAASPDSGGTAPTSSSSSSSVLAAYAPVHPFRPMEGDDVDDDTSSLSTDTDESAEFFDVMRPAAASGAAAAAAAASSSSSSSAGAVEGELNLLRAQMAACLNRIHSLEHELTRQDQQQQQQQQQQSRSGSEHELLSQQRLDELTALYKRLEQNRRERDRVTHNRLLELENRLLVSRFRRHPVALGVAATVLVFLWPVLAVRIWDRVVRGGSGAGAGGAGTQWLGGVVSWMGWVFSWAVSRFNNSSKK